MHSKISSRFTKKEDEAIWKTSNLSYPRHRWYSYKEGFSPRVVEIAIEEASIKENDLIIDPFNGGGTTTLYSSLKGIHSIGIEVNPFSKFISEAKQTEVDLSIFNKLKHKVLSAAEFGKPSDLLKFSTFSEQGDHKGKWLFNSSVLNAFEAGRQTISKMPPAYSKILRLALISAAMDNSNAIKDGKCLRYRDNWVDLNFSKSSFINTLESKLQSMIDDITAIPKIKIKSQIIEGDARKVLALENQFPQFKLCITSPPYLNSFDYTDIYRPELFLGKFIQTNSELKHLRKETIRSHVEIRHELPKAYDFGVIYTDVLKRIAERTECLWDKQIPVMIQAYFEDIESVLKSLKKKATKDAQLWIVVSNSAYADIEVPVDLIIAEIGSRIGFFLKEIGVLRYVTKRKTKHSNNIKNLRESIIIFTNYK